MLFCRNCKFLFEGSGVARCPRCNDSSDLVDINELNSLSKEQIAEVAQWSTVDESKSNESINTSTSTCENFSGTNFIEESDTEDISEYSVCHNIALVAHDACKNSLVDWCTFNFDVLKSHNLYATGTTGKLISNITKLTGDKAYLECFNEEHLNVNCLHSGPLGGDQELGAMICNGQVDILIFFADHLSMQPHDSDIKALSRLGGLYNIPMACNRATADFLISSPLFSDSNYSPEKPNFESYINRKY